MKTSLSSLILSALLVAATAVPASAAPANEKTPAPQTESEIIAKARAEYPLKTCVVSDEALGNMGDAVPFVHRAAGKPERVVFMCCEGCIDDFKADPAKYLKKLDDAGKSKTPAKK